jgi:DsbC/DsbD-like thiol-disulfide interchange protein
VFASLTNGQPVSKRIQFSAMAVVCLLAAACDPATPGPVQRQVNASAESPNGSPTDAARPVGQSAATTQPVVAPAQKSTVPAEAAPDDNSPVRATLRTDKNAARDGETFAVIADVQIAPGWHIYAIDRPTGPAVPTKITLDLPAGLESAGGWTSPEPAPDSSSAGPPAFVYHDAVAFRQTIRVKHGTPAGPIVIPVEFRYQVCDQFSCRPPATRKLRTSIEVVP